MILSFLSIVWYLRFMELSSETADFENEAIAGVNG